MNFVHHFYAMYSKRKKLLILQYQSVRDCATTIKCAAHTLLIFSNTYTFEWQTLILIGGSFHCLQCQIFLCAFFVISQCHRVRVSCVHRKLFAERGKLNRIPDRTVPNQYKVKSTVFQRKQTEN